MVTAAIKKNTMTATNNHQILRSPPRTLTIPRTPSNPSLPALTYHRQSQQQLPPAITIITAHYYTTTYSYQPTNTNCHHNRPAPFEQPPRREVVKYMSDCYSEQVFHSRVCMASIKLKAPTYHQYRSLFTVKAVLRCKYTTYPSIII